MEQNTLFFFNGHPEALPLYRAFEERLLVELEGVIIQPQKSQITLKNRRVFGAVSFLAARKAKDRPDPYITITLGLNRREGSPRIDQASEPYPGAALPPGPVDPPSGHRVCGGDRRRTDGLGPGGLRLRGGQAVKLPRPAAAKRLPLRGSWLTEGQTERALRRNRKPFRRTPSDTASPRHLPQRGRLCPPIACKTS